MLIHWRQQNIYFLARKMQYRGNIYSKTEQYRGVFLQGYYLIWNPTTNVEYEGVGCAFGTAKRLQRDPWQADWHIPYRFLAQCVSEIRLKIINWSPKKVEYFFSHLNPAHIPDGKIFVHVLGGDRKGTLQLQEDGTLEVSVRAIMFTQRRTWTRI